MDAETAIGSLMAVGRRLTDLMKTAADMPRDEALSALARVLDEIAVTFHDIPNCPPDDREGEAGEPKPLNFGLAVAKAFPELGYYYCADPDFDASDASDEEKRLAANASKLLIADARNDLAELLTELELVRWRQENLGAQGAAWYACLMQGHTLGHLFGLRRALHHEITGW